MIRIPLPRSVHFLAFTLIFAACSGGLERYPAAVDYDQMELRRNAHLRQRSRAPEARREEHSELMDQLDRQVAYGQLQEERARQRRIELLMRANREQIERFEAWEAGAEATAERRAILRARRYPTREEGLELLRQSEQMRKEYRQELHARYTWSQGKLYTEGPERVQREAEALRLRQEEYRRQNAERARRMLEEAKRQMELRKQEQQAERERNLQFALQNASPSLPAQPDVAAGRQSQGGSTVPAAPGPGNSIAAPPTPAASEPAPESSGPG